jgi:hypothetical protein
MWMFLNIVNLVDFSFWYTLKIPFYHFFHTKLIFLTGLLLEVYRFEAGRRTLIFQLVDIRQLLQEISGELDPLAQENH